MPGFIGIASQDLPGKKAAVTIVAVAALALASTASSRSLPGNIIESTPAAGIAAIAS